MSNNYHSTNVLFFNIKLIKKQFNCTYLFEEHSEITVNIFLVFEFADGFVDDKNQEITEKTISGCAKLD